MFSAFLCQAQIGKHQASPGSLLLNDSRENKTELTFLLICDVPSISTPGVPGTSIGLPLVLWLWKILTWRKPKGIHFFFSFFNVGMMEEISCLGEGWSMVCSGDPKAQCHNQLNILSNHESEVSPNCLLYAKKKFPRHMEKANHLPTSFFIQ